METVFTNPIKLKQQAAFVAKDNIVYRVENPRFIDSRTVHLGFISINEYNREHGIPKQIVNFGPAGAYLFPLG